MDLLEKYTQEVADNLAKRSNRALDPTTIITIADIIFQIIEKCQERRNTQNVIDNIKNPRLLQRVAVRKAIRDNFGRNDDDLAEALIETGQNADANDIEDFLQNV